MDQVFYHVGIVVNQWSNHEPGTYGMDKDLQALWTEAFPINPPYNPNGIVQLLFRINHDSLFATCQQALHLSPGHFIKGGSIQTVRHLYEALRFCANPNLGFPK